MSNEKVCSHCGAKTVEYAHTLSKGIIRALAKVVMKIAPGREFMISACGLTYSERENIRKLQYWGLIHKLGDESCKGGNWKITDRGIEFLTGSISLQPKVWTYRGVVQRFDGHDKYIHSITGGWKYRPDYAKEAVPHE